LHASAANPQKAAMIRISFFITVRITQGWMGVNGVRRYQNLIDSP
jgi:hypothetical protein